MWVVASPGRSRVLRVLCVLRVLRVLGALRVILGANVPIGAQVGLCDYRTDEILASVTVARPPTAA